MAYGGLAKFVGVPTEMQMQCLRDLTHQWLQKTVVREHAGGTCQAISWHRSGLGLRPCSPVNSLEGWSRAWKCGDSVRARGTWLDDRGRAQRWQVHIRQVTPVLEERLGDEEGGRWRPPWCQHGTRVS